MSRFLDALHSGRVLLMDGAMGTELQRAGIGEGECYELWNLTHPEKVRAIHQAYVDAGAEVLLTHTFQANVGRLSELNLLDKYGLIVRSALSLVREAAGPDRYVLYDVGPFKPEQRRWSAAFIIGAARAWRTEAVLIETCSDIADVARLIKSRNRGDVKRRNMPILMSWTFKRVASGPPRTKGGHGPESCARQAEKLDVVALGVNCGRDIGMDEVIEIVRRYRRVTDLPLFARPNAGTPKHVGNEWVYPLTPEEMARRLPELLEAGVSMVGGCCGTTPAHIAAMRPVVDAWNERPK